MATKSVRITGLRELEKRLQALPPRIANKHLTKAVRAGAREIGQDARRRVPRNTGRLARAVYWFSIRKRNTRYAKSFGVSVRSGGIFQGGSGWRSGKSLDDPKNAYYWTFLEFGTRYQRAQPFLRPAFETNKRSAVNTIADVLRKALDTEARQLR